ncbi:MAG: hypothetical protein Q8L26_08700 [Candidatus Omnitrophota bacterium]|nr:hypothetical protein [Candidatus Omnitrophota bacterium]
MSLSKPKFIAIDSSILGKWAEDAYSQVAARREIASRVLNQILSENWILVISWYHFEELIRHPEETIAESRMRFILNLPHVAWIWKADGSNHIGSVVDVLAAEIKVYLSAECDATVENLFSATRVCLLRFGAPSDIPTLKMWRELRQDMTALGLGKKQQEVASILHARHDVNDNAPLSVLKDKLSLSSGEEKLAYQREVSTLKNELVTRGDKRLLDHQAVARDFCNDIFSNITEISKSSLNTYEAFAKQFGYTLKDLPEGITLGEFRDMAARRQQVAISTRQLGLEIESIWPRLKSHRLPSEEIIYEIRRSRRKAIRASGSDLNDEYITSLMPYLDAVVVDKRTHEYLRQAKKRNPHLPLLITSMLKVGSYRQLPRVLSEMGNTEHN